ncbi:MAG TPA: ATPase, T2SS/T4P/T4SS family, partial [Methylomirabilota bacterium]|nr:ATPase, T2SS/T4P/T4SS family [Methylomirabilota bacterium]
MRSGSDRRNGGEERELRDSARMFEAALVENPSDLTILEALREIYTRLGDLESLLETTDRIARVDGGAEAPSPRRRRGAAPAEPEPSVPPADAIPLMPLSTVAPPAPIVPPPPLPLMPVSSVAPPPPIAPPPAPPPMAPPPIAPVRVPAPALEPVGAGKSVGAPSGKKRASRPRLGELLVAEGLISPDQLHEALREHRRSKERLGAVLSRRGLVTEERLVELLSKEHGLPSVDVRQHAISPEILALIPVHLARKHEVLPLARTDSALTLAMSDPSNVVAMDEVVAATRLSVLPVVAAGAAIRAAIDRHYAKPVSSDGMGDVLAELVDATVEVADEEPRTQGETVELRDAAEGAPVVKFVNKVLLDAIRRGASDLHWEPYERHFRIRFRIDGVMQEMVSPPKKVEAAVISRLKIMANLDISERRLPQDGRIKLRYGSR